MESKVNKKFKKFAKALNEAYRKDGIYSIKVHAEIFNDRENKWGYEIVENKALNELNKFQIKFEKLAAKIDKSNSDHSTGLMKALKNI